MSKEEKVELNRFTTLINPLLLSNIKLVSYFTNKKLYEVINESLELYIEDFEIKYNTKIDSIIQLQNSFNHDMKRIKNQLLNKYDIVYSSPAKRCIALAESLKFGEIIKDKRLLEIDFGDWEGIEWDQIDKNLKPKPGSYRGRLSSEPENIRKTLLSNKNA